MKTLLISQDLRDMVEDDGVVEEGDGKEKKGIETSDEAKENKRDAKDLYLIQQSISDKKNSRIIGARSAKEAWDFCKTSFKAPTK
jgi:hypothetical protein